MIRFHLLLIGLFTLINSSGFPQASFVLSKKEICINEQLSLTNTSVNAESYIWDYSFTEFENPGISQFSHQITGANRTDGIDIIYENGEWIGFVTDRSTGLLKRLEFGNSLSNAPKEYNLGVIGVKGNGIRLLKEAGNWYALMPSYGNGSLYRLTFGENIKSNPTIESLGNISAWNLIRGSDLIIHKDSIYSVISAYSNDKVTIINFGKSITNSPVWHRDIQHAGMIDGPVGLSLHSDGNRLYSLISSNLNHKIVILYFSEDLASEVLYEIDGIISPTDVEIVKNGYQFYGIVLSAAAKMYKLSFGKKIITPTLPSAEQINLEGDALQTNTWCFRQVRTTPDWQIFVLQMTGNLKQIRFEDQILPNTTFEPQNISYSSPGTYAIELTAFSANGNLDTFMDTVVVRDAVAPTTSVTSTNACLSNPNTFSASSSDDASVGSWNWDFGDGNTASGKEVNHQYVSPGAYNVGLSINAANGCSNTSNSNISIFTPPVADFTYPSTITCSNSPIDFGKATTFAGPDSLLTYQWDLNGEAVSSEANPSYTFTSGGDKNITLSASIPGCASEISKLISITPGPLTSFSFNGVCQYDDFVFSNNTTGEDITGYQWDFGDGYTSTNTSPSHQFANGGSFVVGLKASNVLGCDTEVKQVVPVGHIPTLNFTHDLACSDNEVTFFDQSEVAEANITGQTWMLKNIALEYDKNANGPSPTFLLDEPGEYEMTLISQSNFSCADTLVRNIEVRPSPKAQMLIDNTCFGDSTLLSQEVILPAGETLSNVDWLIEGKTFTENQVRYKFLTPGSYEVQLFARASNLCPDNVTKTVTIHPLPQIDFSLSAFCEDQSVSISAIANSPQDPVKSYQWDIDNKPVSVQANFDYIFKKSAEYEISLSVNTENNCFNSINRTVDIHPAPVSRFDVFPSIGASPLNVQFTDRSQGASKWKYLFSQYSSDSSTARNPSYVYHAIGVDMARLVVANDFGCTDTSFNSIDVVIPVYDAALSNARVTEKDGTLKFSISMQNKGTMIINNPVIRMDIGKNAAVNYKIESTLMPGDFKDFLLDVDVQRIGTNALEYVCLSVNTQLGEFADVNIYDNEVCVNIDNVFTVLDPFPNPSNTFVEIPVILPTSGSCQLKMIDEKGQLVYSRKFEDMISGLNTIHLDLVPYRKGFYLLTIATEELEISKKIVVQ